MCTFCLLPQENKVVVHSPPNDKRKEIIKQQENRILQHDIWNVTVDQN